MISRRDQNFATRCQILCRIVTSGVAVSRHNRGTKVAARLSMRLAVDTRQSLFRLIVALVFITAVALLIAECPSLSQFQAPIRVEGFEPDVPNLMEARDGIYTGGQPTPSGMRRLAERGVRTVVNLRPHTENGARDESIEAANLGMTYFSIPVTASNFSIQTIQDLHCVLNDRKNYPIYIHCRTGNRVGGAWFVHRVLFEKASIPEALTEGKLLGMEPVLEPTLLQLVEEALRLRPQEICSPA